jgi:hypothetical protein
MDKKFQEHILLYLHVIIKEVKNILSKYTGKQKSFQTEVFLLKVLNKIFILVIIFYVEDLLEKLSIMDLENLFWVKINCL